ncbi:MAG TPA: carboxypeptidase-like regulatory domain-containing protein, partial [Chitinophagaceae bacterium]|nr:carboxypeptidase-like regulatory domain-containing protein [Chitinophagaceae bacterium]
MMKKATALMLLALLYLGSTIAFGQEKKQVSGTITDNEGRAITGVTIKVKGGRAAAISDETGSFTISAATGDVLVFTSIGFEQKETTVGGTAVISIRLNASSANLEGVVVTALGIKKQARSLGYAVSTVTAKDLTMTGSTNF